MEKKTNKAKLEISNFSENRQNRKAIAFDKISRNCAFYGNSINTHLLGYFCMQIFVNCLIFSLKLLSKVSKKVIKYYL